MFQSYKKIFPLTLIGFFLAGCSSLKIGYHFADNLLIERADNYLLFDAEQESMARQTAAQLIAWHRREMLPRYADFLEAQAEQALIGHWHKEDMATAFQEYRRLLKATIEGAAPFVSEVLLDQSHPENLAYLEQNMTKALEERVQDEKEETPEESLSEWVERQQNNLERFTGALEADQIQIITRFAERDAFLGLRWLENRSYRQQAFLDFMAQKPEKDAIEDFLIRILLHPYEIVDPDYRAITEQRFETRQDLYFEVLNSLNKTQRDSLVANLRDYARDLRELSGGVGS